MVYPDCPEYEVEVGDRVKFMDQGLGWFGSVKSLHSASGFLSITFQVGEYRTTGRAIFRTAKFSINDVEFLRRDGA